MVVRGARRALRAACLLLAVAAPALAQRPAAAPTTILTGGRVFTADSARPWAEAVAVRGDRVLAVGTTADVRRVAGRGAREIALGGRVVIPGINDAHDHLGDVPVGIEFRTSASPTPDPEPGQVLGALARLTARAPAGRWLRTTVGLRALDDATLRRDALDRVAPDNPVLLWTWWGHGALLNTAALRALGVADSAADPLGGWYERDRAGRLTGRLDEYAEWGALRRLYSSVPEDALVAGLRTFADSSLMMGVTTVQDMAGYETPGRTVSAFRAAGLPIRVRLIRWPIPDARGRNEAEWDTVDAHPAPRVRVSGRKWVIDGTPIERNALRRAAYAGPDGGHGRLDFPADTIRAILAGALRPGAAQLHLHIVGDSTAEVVLAQMRSLAPDSAWRARRVRFEHGGVATDSQLVRARRLGIVIAQPRAGSRLRAWHDAGIPLAYGSDGLRNPFYNMMNMVTGEARPDQAISREAAMTALTRGAAYAEFSEREKGTLAPGMLADLAVLSQDVFAVAPPSLPETTSVLTMVGGEIVRDVLTGSGGAAAGGAAARR